MTAAYDVVRTLDTWTHSLTWKKIALNKMYRAKLKVLWPGLRRKKMQIENKLPFSLGDGSMNGMERGLKIELVSSTHELKAVYKNKRIKGRERERVDWFWCSFCWDEHRTEWGDADVLPAFLRPCNNPPLFFSLSLSFFPHKTKVVVEWKGEGGEQWASNTIFFSDFSL